MSQSIHDAAVPLATRALRNLSVVIEKGRQYAEAEKWDPAVLLATRLHPDMFPLSRQIQVVSDQCKGGIARLAAVEPPKFPDTETTFAELEERLDKTIAFVKSVEAQKFEGAGERAIELKFPQATLNFNSGWEFFLGFMVPNVYFHCSMTYGILRNCGVKLGKADFMGGRPDAASK
jgi:hypothetical protein